MSQSKEERKAAKRARKEKRRLERIPWTETVRGLFETLAIFISTHPWKVCLITFFFNGLLGFGMINLPRLKLLNNDIEDLYVPKGSPTQQSTDMLLKLFPDKSASNFYPHQNVKQPMFTEIMLWKHDRENMINATVYDEIKHIMDYVKNISTFTVEGGYAKYPDVCARRIENCVIEGEEILDQIRDNTDGTIPLSKLHQRNSIYYENSLDHLGNYTADNGTLKSAGYVKIRFHLRQDTENFRQNSKLWQSHFITYMKKFVRKQYPKNLHITFSHSGSFYEELGNDTYMDIPYFSFVFTIFLTYLGFVMSGGNIISKRVNIGRIGIIVTPVSVLGAWGILMGCGLEFTNTVGVIPLLIQFTQQRSGYLSTFLSCIPVLARFFAKAWLFFLSNYKCKVFYRKDPSPPVFELPYCSHQIINAMITLSHVSDVNDIKDAHKRVAYAVRRSCLPISLTTLVHVIPFLVGLASHYYVTKLVSIYFVTTMLFNYFNHFVFFTACLALHEHRIDAELHFCCWNKLTPREQLRTEGRNCCVICCCSGLPPESREDTESGTERITRKLMSRYILTAPMKFITTLIFLAYVVIVCWGLAKYDFDSVQVNKVLEKSYYSNWDKYWAREYDNTTTIQFITIHPYGYTHNKTIVHEFQKSISTKIFLQEDSLHSWYESYIDTDYKDFSSEKAFLDSVETRFIPENPIFKQDLVGDKIRPRVIASRFYMKTKDVPSTKAMMKLKDDLSSLVDEVNDYIKDQLEVWKPEDDDHEADPFTFKVDDDKHFLVHCPDFLATDWYMMPLWEIMMFCGVQLTFLFVLTLVLHPSLGLALQVPFWYITMVAGIFGMSHFVGIYLTPVPMILYMVAGGYCAEVIAHTHCAFMDTDGVTKGARMNAALSTISQCLFHTIFGQFLGLLVLLVDESYVFVTVCQLSLLTTGSCVIHCIFFMPTILSFVGPGEEKLPKESEIRMEMAMIRNGSSNNVTQRNSTSRATNGTSNNSTINGVTNRGFQV